MKIKDLKRLSYLYGYEYEIDSNFIYLSRDKNNIQVDLKNENTVYFDISECDRNDLMMIDLARNVGATSLIKRHDYKRVILQHKYLCKDGKNYLIYDIKSDTICLGSRIMTENYKSEFTEKEIEKLRVSKGLNVGDFYIKSADKKGEN